MHLAGRRGRVPLVVSWELPPVPVAILRLKRVRGGGVVPLIVRVVLLLVGRGEEFPEDAVCLVGRGRRVPLVDSLKPLPKLVVMFLLEPVGNRRCGMPLAAWAPPCLVGRGEELAGPQEGVTVALLRLESLMLAVPGHPLGGLGELVLSVPALSWA